MMFEVHHKNKLFVLNKQFILKLFVFK